jgi:hypothetical protein
LVKETKSTRSPSRSGRIRSRPVSITTPAAPAEADVCAVKDAAKIDISLCG